MKSKVCSFFGHRKIEITEELEQKVKEVVEDLIVNHNVLTFLFGSRSDFDYLCHSVVTELKEKYPDIIRKCYTCRSETCTLESERSHWEEVYSHFKKEKVTLLGVEGEIMNNKTFGKTIELFFVDGTSDGVVTAELRNWSGKAIKIPRIEVGKYNNEELSYVGVYLLYCTDEIGNEKIYVGESEDVYKRLKQHISEYDKGKESYYWSYAVAFVDNRLDKAEIRYIEDRLVNEIYDVNPSRLLTKSSYGKTNLKPSQIAVAEEFINNIKILLGALGIKLVAVAPKAESNTQYMYCKGKESKAKGFISNNGFTVLKDSTINTTTADSFSGLPYWKLRQKLIEEKVIVGYKFVKDYEFNAPSAASSVVLGRASNGKHEWKTQTGKMLRDL